MKFLQLFGIVCLAAVSFCAGASHETSGLWSHSASLFAGLIVGVLGTLAIPLLRDLVRSPRADAALSTD